MTYASFCVLAGELFSVCGFSRNAAINGRRDHGYAVGRLRELRDDERHRREHVAAKEVEVFELEGLEQLAEVKVAADEFVCYLAADSVNDGYLENAFGIEVHSAHDFEFHVVAVLFLKKDFVLRLAAVVDRRFDLKSVERSATKIYLDVAVFEEFVEFGFFHIFLRKKNAFYKV